MENLSIDIDELKSSYEATLKHLKSVKWTKKTALTVLEKMGDQTFENVFEHQCVPGDEACQYDSCDIGMWLDRKRGDAEASRNWLKPHLKAYRDYVEQNKDELDEYLRQQGCKHRLVIDDTGSRGGERNHYYLSLQEVLGGGAKSIDLPSCHIEYQVRQIPKLLPCFEWMRRIDLEGWKIRTYLGAPLTLGVGWVLLMLWVLPLNNDQHLPALVLYSTILVGLWIFVHPFYDLVNRRVSMAPSWMLPFKVLSAQLEMVPTDGRKVNGAPIRSIRLVRYGGDCPICGAPIAVISGTREFRGRLIGQCNESGTEHVFSFDHVSKIGVPLRGNAYYGISNKQFGNYYRDHPDC